MRRPRRPTWKLLAALLLALPLFTLPILFATLARPRASPGGRIATPPPPPPRLAYLLSGEGPGDAARIRRLLRALYHPWNSYLLDLDAAAPERADLEVFIAADQVMRRFGNVRIAPGHGGVVSPKGPTALARTLHCAAIMTKEFKNWSWFINLSAADYPLMSQDDILHIFSYIPRDLNFIEHTSNIGWKEHQRVKPIVIDPALYLSNSTALVWVKEKRSLPSAFKLFVGSSRTAMTRSFLEFCLLAWDNLPRTLLVYYANFLSSSEAYFQTVICNSNYFQNTTVNTDLHFTIWNKQPQLEPSNLTASHFDLMDGSGAPFAHPFVTDESILDMIDAKILKRTPTSFTPGGWCAGSSQNGEDPCAVHARRVALRPTARSRKLERFLLKMVEADNFRLNQCI